jgi:hypothetical protein
MSRLLLFIFLIFFPAAVFGQHGYLFIKSGVKKKKVWTEGDNIHIRLRDGNQKKGVITLLMNDTVYINGTPFPSKEISTVYPGDIKKKPFPADGKTMLLITGGVALTAIGLSLNNTESPEYALLTAAAIGYGPLLIKFLWSRLVYTLKRKQYRIGGRFRLQVLDFYIPGKQLRR